jgi:hypothetical protein
MALRDEQHEFLLDMGRLVSHAVREGFQVTGGELWRTMEQQRIYVETGRSKTMNGQHLKRLAIDLNFFKEGVLIQDKESLKSLGEFWQALNPKNRWGGNWTFKDLGHFERQG